MLSMCWVIIRPLLAQFFRALASFVVLIGLVITFTGSARADQEAPRGERPNIVIIMADDMGFSDLGCYGGEIETPNLDRLARGGLRFTQFYNNAICVSTRASLMTGLYPWQVGTASRFLRRNKPGWKLQNCVTIAEVLRSAGYRTLMAGKWHLPGHPRKRGFDRYYGLLTGGCNHFNPGAQRPDEPEPGKKFPGDNQPFSVDDKVIRLYTPPRGFYSTDAFTDLALEFLDDDGKDDRSFFLYVAYTVPHYPLHAPPEDIAKYRGKYLAGWDRLRDARFDRLKDLGLIDRKWKLSPRSPHAPAWNDIQDKDAWDLKMAVYAAMVDRMDRNVGRIMEKLRAMGKEDNTLVLFLSDNGPSDEDRSSTPDIPPGPVESYRTVDLPWANLSNTPFRNFKRWDHEGGISTPLIASWPKVISKRGEITHAIGHTIDVMATCVDIAGVAYPASYNGHKVTPLEGRSLLPIFRRSSVAPDTSSAEPEELPTRPLFWNQRGLWRAVRMGKWKLVSPDHMIQYNPWRATRKGRIIHDATDDPNVLWELYDIEADRTELHNLAQKHPNRVKQLAAMYAAWEKRVTQRE